MKLAHHDRGLLRVYALREARAVPVEKDMTRRRQGVVVATLRERNEFLSF